MSRHYLYRIPARSDAASQPQPFLSVPLMKQVRRLKYGLVNHTMTLGQRHEPNLSSVDPDVCNPLHVWVVTGFSHSACSFQRRSSREYQCRRCRLLRWLQNCYKRNSMVAQCFDITMVKAYPRSSGTAPSPAAQWRLSVLSRCD